jgi:phospholipid transport system transporter-binding protein
MTPQLSWVREGERLVLQGELDQDVLNPCGMPVRRQ